eukprot:gene9860-2183_t
MNNCSLLTFLILLFCYTFVSADISCLENKECPKNHYCTGSPEKQIQGKCATKEKIICFQNDECLTTEICHKITKNFGFCGPTTNTKPKVEGLHDIKVKTLTDIEFAKKFQEQRPVNISFCANEKDFHDLPRSEETHSHSNDVKANCYRSGSCDDPAVRNSYSPPNLGVIIKINWLYFECDANMNSKILGKIGDQTTALNKRFKPLGFQFASSLFRYPCTGTDGNQDYNTISKTEATAALFKEQPNFQKDGVFAIVVGKPVQSNLGGFFYYPGGSRSGSGFMNQNSVNTNDKVLAHELGHGFGLPHTFHGVDEVGCGDCRETEASDVTGDFCADTQPAPTEFKCIDTITGTDSCNPARTQWNNPKLNLMSYTSCSNQVFTTCQKKRMLCYYDKSLKSWVKPTGVYPLGSNLIPGVPLIPFPWATDGSVSVTVSFVVILSTLVYLLF